MKTIDKIYIDGKFVTPLGQQTLELFNPEDGSKASVVTLANAQDVELAVAAAKKAFKTFSKTTIKERGEMLERLAQAILDRKDELNAVAVSEYGSPISATKGRTHYAAQIFLDTKEAMDGFEFSKTLEHATIVQQPLGVIAAITPWNADYTHICGKLAPAIATGCTIVIKPSEISAEQTHLLTECFHAAGIPDGVINILNGTGDVVGAALTSHPDVEVVTFTGSTNVGKIIYRAAADTMKRVVLELGGKSPNVILEDADLEAAIPRALHIAFSNSGQACHAGTRLIIPASRASEIKALLIKAAADFKIGDLQSADSLIGPMVNEKQFDTVQKYIQAGIDEGAELLVGGLGNPDGHKGYYAKPTIFTGVMPGMKIEREEIFGPVLSVIEYDSVEDAIAIANDTIYGLSGYVSGQDPETLAYVAGEILSGRVLVNTVVNRESKSPFGGFKQSGIGRTSWVYGIEEYVEPKVITKF
ncbi:aldehyde dehydrogenase family protein [Pedobacter sp. Leaf194]|uniref:aldehyde dehydrogenase family protein n=1 Tax=Pedobacter sp. Leaf194 TaxID=1736297 RepID=UPI00070261B8|nr:aldehyde dehydrogenase family protein [Pedobacter sp. Leaf194]KQS36220.1 aldehyde dehydrogenase [Pedobacter sp. Leaf194]